MTAFGPRTWAWPCLFLFVSATWTSFLPASTVMLPIKSQDQFICTAWQCLSGLMIKKTPLTSPVSVTLTSSCPWRVSYLYAWIAPLHSLLKVSLALAAPLFVCVILVASPSPSFVPVLRRSCLFQENSATKRVSTKADRRYVVKFWQSTVRRSLQ